MAELTGIEEPTGLLLPPSGSPVPPPPRTPRRTRPPLRWALHLLVTVMAAALAVLTIVGFAGRWWWVFDICANYRFQLAVIAVPVLIAALALRRWITLGVAVAVLAVNTSFVAPLYLDRPPPAPGGAPELVIEHLNLQGWPADLTAFRRSLESDPADVIVLLETNDAWTDGLAHLDVHGYRYAAVDQSGRDVGPVVVLSRVPIHGVHHPRTPGLPPTSVEFSVDFDGQTVDVLGVHTLSPKNETRSTGRDAQFRAIAGWTDAQQGPVVVLGDLNSTPWSHAFRDLISVTDLQSSQDGFGFQPTWPAQDWPLLVPIDHSLHTPTLTVLDRRTGPGFGSSHRSLTVTYAFR